MTNEKPTENPQRVKPEDQIAFVSVSDKSKSENEASAQEWGNAIWNAYLTKHAR